MGASDWGIGHEVSGTTASGEAFSGSVFTYDEGTKIAVLRTEGEIINTHDVRVLNTEGMRERAFEAPASAVAMDALPVVDRARSERREEANVKAALTSAANIGVGVTQEAQDIFDAIARTLPCSWEGKVIKVMDEVTIAPPYAVCAGAPRGRRACHRAGAEGARA